MDRLRNSFSEAVEGAKNLVVGSGPTQSGAEPVSGRQGAGTADEPYDQGNALNTTANRPDANLASSGVEPPSGVKGPGTADKPYDQGNAPAATANKLDTTASTSRGGNNAQGVTSPTSPTSPSDGPALSKVTSKPGTPYDIIGLSRKASKAQQSGEGMGTPTKEPTSSPLDTRTDPSTTSQTVRPAAIAEEPVSDTKATATPAAAAVSTPETTTTTAPSATTAPPSATAASASSTEPPAPAGDTPSQTSAEKQPERTSRPSQKWPAKEKEQIRDISPGTLDDGSHATTSGDRGESYEPGKLNRLKGAFGIGKH